MKDSLIEAHKFSSNQGYILKEDKLCGCFNCLVIFNPKEIYSWIEDTKDKTAICPNCNVDSIIGESSGYPITKEFLIKMNEYWF